MGKKWKNQEELFIIKNYKIMTDEEIGYRLNRSEKSVSAKRKRLGIIRKNNNIVLKLDKKDIIQRYKKGDFLKDISKDYNIVTSTLIRYLRKWNVFIPRNIRWSNDEIRILKEKYPVENWDVLLQLLSKHNKNDIIDKASSLKIKKEKYHWTDNDIKILNEEYIRNTPTKEIVKKLNFKFTDSAIATKAYKLNIKKVERWSDEELEYLINNYENVPMDEIDQKLHKRKRNNITSMANKLGLTYNLTWTKDEDIFIKENYKKKNDYEIAESLGRTRRSIKCRRQKLGLESYFYNNFGNNYVGKDGTICLSYGELQIHNYLINMPFAINKEVYYKDILSWDNSNRRFDWIIHDSNGITWLVEYFGMYDTKRKENKARFVYKKNTRKKIKDLYKAGVIDKCIFIFPNDLKNKTLDEIFGKYINLD